MRVEMYRALTSIHVPDETAAGVAEALQREVEHQVNQANAVLIARMDVLDGKIEAMNSKFDARFDAILTRIEAMTNTFDAKFDAINTKFDAVHTKFDAMNTKFDALNAKVDTVLRGQDVRWRVATWTIGTAVTVTLGILGFLRSIGKL